MNPIFVRHRVNRIEDIEMLMAGEGAEVDLRSDPCRPGSIILHHDPWSPGVDFSKWLEAYVKHATGGLLILNTKEDGLEETAEQLVMTAGANDFFFLDTTMPTLVRRAVRDRHKRHAVRLSSREPLASIEAFIGFASWVWVDCLFGEPLPPQIVGEARRHFKVCLASPELHGFPLDERFAPLWPLADAICTDDPAKWLRLFG